MYSLLQLNSPYFVACVDLGHSELTGTEAEDFILKTDANLLKALHVQDGNYLDDSHTLPFLGKYNWEEIMKALKKINYDGELTFEIVKYLRNFPKELLPEAMRLAEKTGRYLISLYDKA